MGFDELQNDPYFAKFIKSLARIIGEYYQTHAAEMTADEIIENAEFFPMFNPETHDYETKNAGYVCRTPEGNVVSLVQPYNSNENTSTPEEIESSKSMVRTVALSDEDDGQKAEWRFYWSSDPKKATPYIKLLGSPYNQGQCCKVGDDVYRSTVDNNLSSPYEGNDSWEKIPAEELQ